MIEIFLNENVKEPFVETLQSGVVRLTMHASTPISDALEVCRPQMTPELGKLFLDLFSERGFKREYEKHDQGLVIRSSIDP